MKFRYFSLVCFISATSLPRLILSQNNAQDQPPNFQFNSVSDGGQQMQANNQFNSVSNNQQVPFNNGFSGQQTPQNGQFNQGSNGQFFPRQQPSPWSALSGLLSQIPIASVVQMVMNFVQNSPFMYVLTSIFGKSVVTFQILSLAYSFFAVMSFFFPQFGELVQQQIGSITNVLAPFSPYNLPGTIQSMQPIAATMNMVGINNPNCQLRAACEGGQIVARNFPAFAQVVNVLGNVLPIEPAYQQPFLSGTNNVNCAAAFNSCPQSPIKALFNLNPPSQNSQNRRK